PLEDRISMFERIAIAIIDGYADKPLPKITRAKAAMHFIEADDLNPGTLEELEDAFQELRCYFQEPVRLESAMPRRSYVVQHQDGTDTGAERAHHQMSAAEIKRFKSGTDDCSLEPGHVL